MEFVIFKKNRTDVDDKNQQRRQTIVQQLQGIM